MPKFRGDSNDWLDDEQSEGGGGRGRMKKKPSHARAEALPAEQANGLVAEVYPNLCRVISDEAGETFLCAYRRAGVLKSDEVRERTFVTVGDRVRFARSGDQGVIEGVCERRNRLLRPAPGHEGKKVHHVIAANLDQVAIVVSAREPLFTPGLVDRFLVAAQAAEIEPLVCVTKIDLCAEEEDERPWRLYSEIGVEVLEMSARTGEGIPELLQRIEGETVLFCGQSGAGKTSLLSSLLGREAGRIGDVSEATGKGKHTTTSTVLLGGPGESKWIDSPGIREFGLADVAPKQLAGYFEEFRGIRCAVPDCTHSGEEGCSATGLPRYASYRRILESLKAGEH